MRLFTAIELHSDLLLPLERLLSALRPEALVKWSPLDNLHITLKFIGEWPEQRLPELHAALSHLEPCEPFELSVKNLGWFPNERSPRVLWVGVHGGEPLRKLAATMETRLESLGIKREAREFSPHLTLARIKVPTSLRRLREKVQELQPANLGSFRVHNFTLFRSDPGSNASIYRRLYEYNLESALAAS
jgi:RNA 2',3'-cyclic 3'-phosphodiesterase